MRDRDAYIAAAQQAGRDMLDMHVGRRVGLRADRAKPVGRVLGERRRGPDPDEQHLARGRDQLHRLLESAMVDRPNAFSDGLRGSGEHFDEDGAHRVRVSDVAVVERLGPDFAGQGELKVAIAAESHSLTTPDDGRRRGLRAPRQGFRRRGHRAGRIVDDRSSHARIAWRQRRQEAPDPGEHGTFERRR